MARLIDADITEKILLERYKALAEEYGHYDHYTTGYGDALDVVEEAPTVDAVPVVHGRWERCGGDLHSRGYAIFCSICNRTHFVHRKYSLGGLTDEELFKKPKYCPSCGAVMESEE